MWITWHKKIREIALNNQVPLVENPPLARSLYKMVEVDKSIPKEHYQVVAEIIKIRITAKYPKTLTIYILLRSF